MAITGPETTIYGNNAIGSGNVGLGAGAAGAGVGASAEGGATLSKFGKCPICGRTTSMTTLNALGMCSFCWKKKREENKPKPTVEEETPTAEEAVSEGDGETPPSDSTCGAGGTTTPTFGEGAGAGIPTPEVTPAPAYEKSEAQIAFEEMLGGKITDWVESGGYGIPKETQALMIQQQTDSLKARETESIRVMRNNMERRGITNSGFIVANEQNIRSNTTVAIAGAIADVQIKSALLKMANFEKAMGQAGQFLGYLSEQSELAYAPEFATWQAEQLATMQHWQGKMDIYKMEINQAYQTQNIELQGQLQSQLNQEQHQYDIELAEMEIEASNKIAMMQGIGGIVGTVLGFIFGS